MVYQEQGKPHPIFNPANGGAFHRKEEMLAIVQQRLDRLEQEAIRANVALSLEKREEERLKINKELAPKIDKHEQAHVDFNHADEGLADLLKDVSEISYSNRFVDPSLLEEQEKNTQGVRRKLEKERKRAKTAVKKTNTVLPSYLRERSESHLGY